MRKTISAMLDFIIAALAASPSVMLPPSSPQSIPLIFSPDEQSRQQNERVEQGRGPWSVVLWNDEKHSYDQVITQLCRANRNTTRRTALDAANRVDSIGRDVVSTTTDIVHLYTSARIINNIDLACTISSSQSVFYENVAGLLINALHDLAQTSVLSSDGSQRLLRPIRQIIAEELLKKDDEARQTSRFIKLLQADLKLWKRARIQLRSLYGQLIVLGGDIRTALGGPVYSYRP